VSYPGATVEVWQGVYGGAVVVDGDPFAITSDGVRHEI
jgi:hypothetical protein